MVAYFLFKNKFGRFMGVCSDIQNRMTACFQKEVSDQQTSNINLRISLYYFLIVFG